MLLPRPFRPPNSLQLYPGLRACGAGPGLYHLAALRLSLYIVFIVTANSNLGMVVHREGPPGSLASAAGVENAVFTRSGLYLMVTDMPMAATVTSFSGNLA